MCCRPESQPHNMTSWSAGHVHDLVVITLIELYRRGWGSWHLSCHDVIIPCFHVLMSYDLSNVILLYQCWITLLFASIIGHSLYRVPLLGLHLALLVPVDFCLRTVCFRWLVYVAAASTTTHTTDCINVHVVKHAKNTGKKKHWRLNIFNTDTGVKLLSLCYQW